MSEEMELALTILIESGFVVLSVDQVHKQFVVTLPAVR
jgi:hypothetical protein